MQKNNEALVRNMVVGVFFAEELAEVLDLTDTELKEVSGGQYGYGDDDGHGHERNRNYDYNHHRYHNYDHRHNYDYGRHRR